MIYSNHYGAQVRIVVISKLLIILDNGIIRDIEKLLGKSSRIN